VRALLEQWPWVERDPHSLRVAFFDVAPVDHWHRVATLGMQRESVARFPSSFPQQDRRVARIVAAVASALD
jgi:hypothetical protein